MSLREALNRRYCIGVARGNLCYDRAHGLSGWGVARWYGFKAFLTLIRQGWADVDPNRAGDGVDQIWID